MAIRNPLNGMDLLTPLNVGFRTIRRLLGASLLLLGASSVEAQNLFTIADGSGNGCQGVIFDSGGQGAAGYSNDENYTFTICPDVPGNVIYLTFTNFDLDQSGPQNSWDQLSIFDGDNTSALPLGDYTGNSLQNIIISGTVFNTSGCLTLVFQSNNVGTGVFAASFQCTIPCQNPTASAVMSETVPALVCQGESVNFNGSASAAQPGYTIQQYLWNFDDGSVDSTSGPIVDHVFTDDGEHVVQLYVTDDNGCKNLNLVDLQVLVSTTPNFGFTSESQSTC
ncbi:MAG: PKD domain-containing protein, partial [Flavobacteriales bacterium]|nr:PKD domain-containing protein [Flavobacteriales bacterium]